MKFRSRFMSALAACAVGLLLVSSAAAQTTSSLTGTVTTAGSPLPGVTVTISSPQMQGTRTAVSGEGGGYSFAAIPPGDYTVRFELEGMQTATRRVQIGVGQSGRADAELNVAALAEAITVTASSASVLETPTVTTNLSARMVEELPIPRTVLATALLAPGVNDSTVSGSQLQISGGPGYDNLVMVNGVAITETIRRQAMPLFIEDAVQETTVMTGAVSAEYGGFTGGVVNTITKSGGNEFSGSLRDSFTNPSWTQPTPQQTTENTDTLNEVYEATLGGFILRDRLWFFAAGRDTESSSLPLFTRVVPGDASSTQFSRTSVSSERRLEGKLTAQITPKHNISGSYFDLTSSTTNSRFTSTSYDLEQFTDREDPRDLKSLFYNGVLTNNLMLEARYSEAFWGVGWGSGSQYTDFVRGTIVRNLADSVARWNSPTFCGVCDKETRTNDGWLAKATYFLSTRSTGNHSLVAGVESFAEHRYANNYQSGSNFRFFVNGVTRVGEELYPRVNPGTNVIWGSSRSDSFLIWTPIFELQQNESDLKTDSVFINDRWDLNQHWSFNLGARFDKNDAVDGSGNKVSDDQKISPRLNVTFDPAGNGRQRFLFSYGEYASRIVDGPATDSSAGGTAAYLYYAYTGPAFNQPSNPTEFTTREVLAMVEQWFYSQCNAAGQCGPDNLDLLATGVGHSVPGYDVSIADTLASPYVREITFGYGLQLSSNAIVRADLVARDWRDFYGYRVDSSTPSVTDLLGIKHDLAVVETTNDVTREYRGLQLQANWRPRRFNFGVNYTLATLKGNDDQESPTSGTVGNVPASMYYPELYGFAQYKPTGYLSGEDQRHRARIWMGYDIPMPRVLGALNVSVLQRFDSGTPYSAAANISLAPYAEQLLAGTSYVSPSSSAPYYFSKRGEFRLDDIHATDLALNYRYPIGRLELFAQGELINAFNNSAVIVPNTTVNLNPANTFNPFTETPVECAQGLTNTQCNEQFGTSGWHWRKGGSAAALATPGQLGTFGKAASSNSANYQTMRTYRFSVGLRF
ncbi:MAG TPA: TonB-dependent receptor [Thermoanaerobaculia bacterium]|nr:TonB-dependent receptor [Thermoanaerobaculia bacterium]